MLFIVTRQTESNGTDFYLVAATSAEETRQLFEGEEVDLSSCVESALFEQYDGVARLGTV
ncbi:MAG: hypothetical protein KJ787_04035 [Gammaproteobacteria bacterium]|nr:hypothetical protein [Gammaproteobacteria bacterium]MBU1645480.1 hypothetical protein [Gammaproteobacteria bacterium]MBU1971103.1 hypothetical protein [Gammaproteobacteria bacterium]